MDDSIFRQNGSGAVPRGVENQAVDASPSEQSGGLSVTRPVWQKFVTNTVAQQNNRAAVREENARLREASPVFKGADGKLLRQSGRTREILDANDWVDDPIAGPEARKSLWDKEVRGLKKDSSDAAFELRNPAFHAGALTDREREDARMESEMLPDGDTRKSELQAKLATDEQYRTRKAQLAQRSFDSEKRARELESTDPETWWSTRQQPTPTQQRSELVAGAQARAGEADAAQDSAAAEMAEIDRRLAQGVRGSEIDALKTRRAEIAAAQGLAAEEKAKAAGEIEAVRQDAAANRGFFANVGAALTRGYAGASQSANILQGAADPTNAQDIADYERMKRENPASKEFQDFMNAEGFAASALAFIKNPVRIISEVMAESAAQMVPSIALGVAGGAIGGAVTAAPTAEAAAPATVPIGAVIGGAIGAGSGSFLAEYGSAMMESMQNAGMDATSPESIQKFFTDPDKLAAAREFAVKRGVPVALFDAASMGIAGKFAKPLQVAVKGGEKVGAGRILAATGAEIASQAGLGAAGEAAGQLVSKGEITDGKSIFLEGIAEIGSAPIEVASNLREFGRPAVEATPEDVLERVSTELAAIDPEAPAPTVDEMANGSMIAPDAPAEGILIERELAAIEAEDAETMDAADRQMGFARQSGDKTAIRAAQDELDAYKAKTGRAPLVRAVLKIAAGKEIDDLTSDELAAVGYKDAGDTFKPMTDKERGDSPPVLRPGADGSLVITDGALKKVGEISPRARSLVKLSESEALQKAKERAAQISTDTQNGTQGEPEAGVFSVVSPHETNAAVEFDVPMRDGTTLRVQAADGAAALEEAAAQAPISGQPATPVAATAPAKPGKAAPAKAKAEGAVNDSTHRDSLKMTPEERRADEKAIQRKLMEASLDTDDKDEQFRRAGYQQVDGFWVHPHVDPAWVAGLKPETKVRLKEGGIKFFDPEHESSGRMVSYNDGTRGMGVRTNADIGHGSYSKDLTVLHELGHHIWQNELTDKQRKDFANGGIRTQHGREVASGKGRGETYNSSIAGGVNSVAEEDFAQHFAENGGDLPKTLSTPKSTSSAAPPAKDQPGKAALVAAKARFAKAKRKLKDRLIEGSDRATTRPDGITINPKQIIDEALAAGMDDKQAAEYFNRVLDEEVRHLAQYDAARALYRATGGTGDFLPWMESHYADIWQNEFVAKGKSDDVFTIYAKGANATEARWNTMSDGDKALEAIRIMSQGDATTESAKLWLNIGESLRKALTAALAALKQFSDIASPALKAEITNLENALKTLNDQSRGGTPKAGGEKPAPGKTGDGTRRPPAQERNSVAGGDGGAEPERRDGAGSPLLVGSKVEFRKNGKLNTGVVSYIGNGAVRIRPDDDPAISVVVKAGDVSVVSNPPVVAAESANPIESRSYDDLVRDTYAGADARRKMEDVRPVVERSAIAYQATGNPQTAKSITDWLASRGTVGAVEGEVKEILSALKLLNAVEAEKAAIVELNRRAKAKNLSPTTPAAESKTPTTKPSWQSPKVKVKVKAKASADAEAPGAQAPGADAPPKLSEADQALLDAMEGLFAGGLPESFSAPVPPERIAPLVTVATKYLAEGVNTPEALAERLGALAEGKMRQFSQSIWFALKMAGAPGVDRPDWASIYASTNQDATDENGPRTGEGAGNADGGDGQVGVETPSEAAAEVKGEMTNPENRRPAKEIKAEIIKRVEEEIAKLPEIKAAFSQPKTKGGKRTLNGRIANSDQLFSIFEKGMGWDIHAGLNANSKNFVANVEGTIADLQKKAPYYMNLHITGQRPETVEFSIPGDGTFKLIKDRGTLEGFLARVKAMPVTESNRKPSASGYTTPQFPKGSVLKREDVLLGLQDADYRKKLVSAFNESTISSEEERILREEGVAREELRGEAVDPVEKTAESLSSTARPETKPERDPLVGVDESALSTPLMKEWLGYRKGTPPDTILLFRLGDFYEAFAGDAKILAKEGKVAITKRNGIPMAGIPFHAKDGYIARLVKAGWRVSLAERQAAPVPEAAKDNPPAPTAIPESRNINARHSVNLSDVLTPAGAIKTAALRRDADSAVWHFQGSFQQLAFEVNATINGKSSATDYSRKALAEVKAAQADGWVGTIYKAGTFGSMRIFVKGDQVLTNAGAEALVSGKFQIPDIITDRKGWKGMVSQQAEFAARLTDWLTTLSDSTLESASAFGSKVSTTKIGEWFEIDRGRNNGRDDVMLWLVNPDAKIRGDVGRRTVAISGNDLADALKKVIAYAANKRDGMTPDTAVGFHSYDTFPGVNDAATVGDALRAAGFKKSDVAEAAPSKAITSLDSLASFNKRLRDGDITADEVKTAWESFKANEIEIKKEVMKMTMKELEKFQGIRKPDNKSDAVRMAMEYFEGRFNPGNMLSYGGVIGRADMAKSRRDAMDRAVSQWTDEKIQEQAKERRDAIEARKKALENPETKDEWEQFVYRKGTTGLTADEVKSLNAIRSDYTRHDKIMARGESRLTPEQLAAYDEVRGIDRKAEEQARKEREATVRGVKADTESEIVETKHTKTGADLFVVRLSDRVEREVYNSLNAAAKKLGGYYSSYRGGGAVPGFQFRDRASAEQFQAITKGETVDRSEAVQERQTERKNAAAERLAAMADKMDTVADASLNADRKTNTAKRAREAGYAEASARSLKAMATTMRNLAAAIESGEATHLDGVRTKTHVETLNALVERARTDAMNDEGLSYLDRQKREGEPATPEQIDKTKYPYPFLNETAWDWLIENGNNTPGAKRLVARLEKALSAKPSIRKNGGYLVDPTGDGMIAVVKELLGKINRQDYTRKNIEGAFERYDRVKAMGLTDLPMLRAALREFLQYRGTKAKTDPVKAMERELVGMKIPGFFPTPQTVIERMLDEVGDLAGKHVLEPSGGKGDIADAAKAAGAVVDVAEMQSRLRDILEARGHKIVGTDFMDMNPEKRGFTYGDVFADKDGKKGILRGLGGMGSDRVRLVDQDGKEIGKYSFSELEGIEKRGSNSGYDAVLMNPPFEDGQDAEHVQRAYQFLKPGGKLVSIMGEGVFGRSDKKSKAFREWLDSVEGTSEKLPEGSFKSAFRPTGVNTRMVVIEKPAAGLQSADLPSPPFYSQLSRVIDQKMPKSAAPAQVLQIATSGAKAEEIKWSGLIPKLQSMGPKVDKAELLAWLADEGSVRFEEVTSSGPDRNKTLEAQERLRTFLRSEKGFNPAEADTIIRGLELGENYYRGNDMEIVSRIADVIGMESSTGTPTKFSQYTLPGGEAYREVVLAMPNTKLTKKQFLEANGITEERWNAMDATEKFYWDGRHYTEHTTAGYTSSHFPDVPNYVAHMRLNERTDANGKPGLFIEELQSDRHQAGRDKGYKGDIPTDEEVRRFFDLMPDADPADYRDEMIQHRDHQKGAVADAPFRKDWPLALFKRALRDAVASGKDWIGWTVGDTQNDRFDLSKQVHRVIWEPKEGGSGNLRVLGKEADTLLDQEMPASKVEDYIGKEAASRLFSQPVEKSKFFPDSQILSGDGLKVGGSGMKGFYDNILPKEIGKYVKQWGGKVEPSQVTTDDRMTVQGRRPGGEWDNSGTSPPMQANVALNSRRAQFPELEWRIVPAAEPTPIHRIDITTEMKKGVQSGQALFAADLPSETLPTLRKRIKVDENLAANSREQQEMLGKNVASGELASFGNKRSRQEQDIVDAEYEFNKVRKTNEDAMKVAKKRLESSRDAVEEKLLKAALGEDVSLDAADEMAFRYLINERSEQAGSDMAKHAENMRLRMALRLERADTARRMQIGYDRTMTPAERAMEAITDAIYTPTRKVEKYAEKLSGAKKLEYLTDAAKERLEKVDKVLKKLGLDLAKVTGKNRDLKLENSKLDREIKRLRNVIEQGVIKMVQKGASYDDIKRRWKVDKEQAKEMLTKAREEAFAKLRAMADSGMTADQIREALKDGLKAGDIPANNAAVSDAELWAMVEQDLGYVAPDSVPDKPRLPRTPKPKTEKAKDSNPLTSDWSRPIFKKGMDEFEFDTKDRNGIMERVEVIRGLAGALGKIDKLEGDTRKRAIEKVAEINAILKKYGTDAAGIFEAAQGIEEYGFDVNDVAQVAAVSRAISMIDADIVDKASEWLYFSMLSGLQTMMVNATTIVPAAWESTVGRGVETAINMLVRDPMSAQLGESKYILKAIRPAITRAMSNARATFAAQHPMFDRDVLAQEVDWERVMGGKGYRTGGSIAGKLGDRVRIPMRILAATDDFNTTLMACVEVGTIAYRIAKAKGMKDGSAEMMKFIDDEVNKPGSFSYVLATEKAKSAIFSNPLPGQHDPVTGKRVPVNDLGDAVGYLAGKLTDTFSKEHDNLFVKTTFAAMRIAFFPFQRTPFNILRKGVRYTLNPFSLFDIGLGVAQNSRTSDGKWQWNAQGRNPELVRRMAMQLQGAMLMLLIAGVGEGDDDDQDKPMVITGSAPFSPRGQAEREAGARSGLGPYRISFRRKDGSERFGFNYGRIEPLATTLAASIDLMKAVKRTLRGGGDATDAASAAMGGFVAQAQDKSFLKGVGDFTELVTNALAEPDLKDNRKMQQFLAGRAAMVVPNIIRQPIREADGQFRERASSFMEELLYQSAPYGQKPGKVDPYGQPALKTGNPIGRTIDVTDAGTNTVHPIDRMLLRYRDRNPSKAWFPSVINSAEFKNTKTGEMVKMNGEQLSEFKKLAGTRMSALMKTTRLNLDNPTDFDVERAKELVSKSRSDAKKLLAYKYSR